jgi:hypothetical protein
MRAVSSAERVFDVPVSIRAAMVALGFLPLMHVAAVLTPVVMVFRGADRWLLVLAPIVLFLLPPLLVRWQPGSGHYRKAGSSSRRRSSSAGGSRRSVRSSLPGCRGSRSCCASSRRCIRWLRAWGSKIGALVYWSPGVAILDRSCLVVGDRVAFGSGVRLNPRDCEGGRRAGGVVLAPITIGSDALIGGFSILLTGCVVAAGEVTPPLRSIHAYTRLEGGQCSRLATAPATDSLDAMVQ